MAQDRYFKLTVMDEDCHPLGEASIRAALEQIVGKVSESKSPGPPVGVLTAANRDHWARARENMCHETQNQVAFEEIDSALFIVCLDNIHGNTDLCPDNDSYGIPMATLAGVGTLPMGSMSSRMNSIVQEKVWGSEMRSRSGSDPKMVVELLVMSLFVSV